ncbi:MAG: KTSC domain-containing protein [Sedimentisphaerales bacterium]|jgi:hypothetical protein
MVEMTYVQSSNVEQVGYDVDNMELYVKFKSSGTIYVYQNVPQEVFTMLMAAPSIGSFINREVKDRYSFRKE